jgi:hypothetical protein
MKDLYQPEWLLVNRQAATSVFRSHFKTFYIRYCYCQLLISYIISSTASG